MTIINREDLIQSVADGLQHISFYHSPDFIKHMARAYEREQSPAAKDAIAQILTNSRMCAEGHRPLCQDTGIVNVFMKIGMDVRWEGFGSGSIADAVNEGVRRAYMNVDNPLRASVLRGGMVLLLAVLTRTRFRSRHGRAAASNMRVCARVAALRRASAEVEFGHTVCATVALSHFLSLAM